MRILAGIVGVLFLLGGVVGGLVGAVVIGDVDTDTSYQCTLVPDQSTGTTDEQCSYDADSDPSLYARQRDLGLALVIGGAAFVVGGCALAAGAAAGAPKRQQVFTAGPTAGFAGAGVGSGGPGGPGPSQGGSGGAPPAWGQQTSG